MIAGGVTAVTLYVSIVLALTGKGESAFLLLSNAFFMVLGMYFRTKIEASLTKKE